MCASIIAYIQCYNVTYNFYTLLYIIIEMICPIYISYIHVIIMSVIIVQYWLTKKINLNVNKTLSLSIVQNIYSAVYKIYSADNHNYKNHHYKREL